MNTKYSTLLINDELLKQFSPIPLDTLTEDFTSFILVSQELYIKPILGDALYNELIEEICDNNLSTENSELIIKIAPALSYLTIYSALPFLWAKIMNKGITILNSENSSSINIEDVSQLRDWLFDISNSYLTILKEWLDANKSIYPLYRPTTLEIANNFISFTKNKKIITDII